MNSRFIIIAILIFIKVIGVASRVKAENYIPGYTCDSSMINKVNFPYYYKTSQISSNEPIYRCGNRKIYKDA